MSKRLDANNAPRVSAEIPEPGRVNFSPASHRQQSWSSATDPVNGKNYSFQRGSSLRRTLSARSNRSTVSSFISKETKGPYLSDADDDEDDVCIPQNLPDSNQSVDIKELDAMLDEQHREFPGASIPVEISMHKAPAVNDPALRPYELPSQESEFSFFATKLESTYYAPDLSSLIGPDGTAASLFSSENGVWWLDCLNPSEREMKVLARAFGIHRLTAEDIATQESREKFELFKNYYFVVFNSFNSCPEHQSYLTPVNFYIIVFQGGVLSFHFTAVDHCSRVRSRARQVGGYRDVGPDWICYALVDQITDSFAPLIHGVEADVSAIEAIVFAPEVSKDMSATLNYLGQTRDRTMRVMRLLSGKAEVLRSFIKRFTDQKEMMPSAGSGTTEIVLFLGDIQDHVLAMHQNLSANEQLLSRCHFNYMGLLQVKYVNSNNQMTVVLNKITVIATVLVPMNMIIGLFSMNVHIPGENVESLQWFFGIIGVVLAAVAILGTAASIYIGKKLVQ